MKRRRDATAQGEGSHGQSRQALRRCGTPLQVDDLEPQADLGVGVAGCEGFTVLRGLLLDTMADAAAAAAAVYDELGSFAADQLSWTALRDGGNVHSLSDTVKAYSGDYEGMMARGGRYRQQLLVRGRKAEALLDLPHLTRMRRAVLAAVERLVAIPAAVAEPVSHKMPHVALLTEQLIRYLPSDRWFAPHYDKDRRDKSHAPLDPKAQDSPQTSRNCTAQALTLPPTPNLSPTLTLPAIRTLNPNPDQVTHRQTNRARARTRRTFPLTVFPLLPQRRTMALAMCCRPCASAATARCSCSRDQGTRLRSAAPFASPCALATCTCCATRRAGSGCTAWRWPMTSRSRGVRWCGACSWIDAHLVGCGSRRRLRTAPPVLAAHLITV